MPTLAVVIPTRNEEAALPATLTSLGQQTEPAERVVVVDGGSQDATVAVARHGGAEVLTSDTPGRGNQIARGVAAVAEAVVLVAHADMIFPPEALARVRQALRDDPACPGGCLGHRFASGRRVYRLIEWYDAFRARRGESYGDQAQFFRRSWLDRVGGFPAQPLLEDVELAARLRRLGRPVYLDCPVLVSPRRFERLGVLRVLWQNWQIRRAYRRRGNAACRALFEWYYHPS